MGQTDEVSFAKVYVLPDKFLQSANLHFGENLGVMLLQL
jgi:hypothetical protein